MTATEIASNPISTPSLLDQLRWKKFPVLNDGFVCLVDAMGSDESIVQAARVSYGAGTKTTSDDETLIRYLMRHRHTTPFEMVEMKFLVRVPMDCWRQWIRHRMASVNEYSTRYSEAIDSRQETKPDEWRSQSGVNKQGSQGVVTEWPEKWKGDLPGELYPPHGPINTGRSGIKSVGDYLTAREKTLHDFSQVAYRERLEAGVAREQARKDLPLSTYTEAYWKIDLHNLFHFLALRMDAHAQQEIRAYATIIGREIVAKLCPMAWRAFTEYRLGAMTLSKGEVQAIAIAQTMSLLGGRPDDPHFITFTTNMFANDREGSEFVAKLQRLGLIGE